MVLTKRETAVQGHSRSSVVVPIHAAHQFLLALNSNLTSIFNHGWETRRLVTETVKNWSQDVSRPRTVSRL